MRDRNNENIIFKKTDHFVSHRMLVHKNFPPTSLIPHFKKKGFTKQIKKKQLTISTDSHTSSRFNLTMYKHQPVILHRISNVIANIGQNE